MENLEQINNEEWYNDNSVFENKPLLFDNQILRKKKFSFGLLDIADRILNRVEQVCVFIWHDYLSEVEAAKFLRIPNPDSKGRETIRNYAIRHKKLSFYKVGRDGLIFHKRDLINFLKYQKSENYRDS